MPDRFHRFIFLCTTSTSIVNDSGAKLKWVYDKQQKGLRK